MANKAANIDARLEAKQAHLNDLKARISQLDQTQTVATKGHTKTNTVCDRGPAREKLIHDIAKFFRGRHGLETCVVLVPPRSLPQTSSGKLSRSRARDMYLDGAFGASPDIAGAA